MALIGHLTFQAWETLLWCDPSNFGGIRSKLPNETKEKNPEDDEEEVEEDEEDEEEDESPEVDMSWNLASYLPEECACQKNFNTVIAGKFLLSFYHT